MVGVDQIVGGSEVKTPDRYLRASVYLILAVVSALMSPRFCAAQGPDTSAIALPPLEPVTSLIAEDFEYDDGERVVLKWIPSVDDRPGKRKVEAYEIYRLTDDSPPVLIATLPYETTTYTDADLNHRNHYRYYIVTIGQGASSQSITTAAIQPDREWVNWDLGNLLVMALVIGGAVVIYIETAKRGRKLFVRKIAGLEAVDEAIGRATEMGRPILYVPGIQDMDDVQTLASLTILGRVAEQIASYDTRIRMPVSRSLVMTAARETIKASYQTAGRPDAYSDDMVQYITDEQFGYVAAVDGIMVREKPATVFLLGAFFAESLILAETGNHIGAIQIAGTARPAQLPFFIAACDFTLIGEELFAASAYLSNEPKALGSLKGQDVGKGIALVAILAGVAAATVYALTGYKNVESILTFLQRVFSS